MRNCLNLFQFILELVCLAFLYARFRFRMSLLIWHVSQGGSDGLILTVLFGIHSFASFDIKRVVGILLAYMFKLL